MLFLPVVSIILFSLILFLTFFSLRLSFSLRLLSALSACVIVLVIADAVCARREVAKYNAKDLNLNLEKKQKKTSSSMQLTIVLDTEDESAVKRAKNGVREMPVSGEKTPRLVENGDQLGRGKLSTYSAAMKSGGTVETIIVPITKRSPWKLGQIFNLIRKASQRIILIEVHRGALHQLTSSEATDDDNVQVFSKD